MEESKGKTGKTFKIFILIILILLIFVFKGKHEIKILNFINSFKSSEKTLLLTNSFDNDNILDINIYNKNIAIWKNNKISFVKTNGEMILEKEFNFLDPAIHYGERYIYPFDKATGDIYFLNKNGETLDRLRLGKEIFNMREINEHLLFHSKDGSVEKIDILDKDWVLIGNPAFEEKNMLSYDINKKGSKILVSVLNLNDHILKSETHYYGGNNEKLDLLTFDGEIVLFNKLVNDDAEVVFTDKALYYIEEKGIIWEKEFNFVKDIYMEDEISILHGNYLETIDFKGQTKYKVGFTKTYKSILSFNGGILLYGDEGLAVTKKGEIVLDHNEPILKVLTNGSEILILGPGSLNIYKLVNKE